SAGQYSLSLKPSLDDPGFDLILLLLGLATGSSRFASSNLSISANYRGSSPRPVPNCRDMIRSWHGRTLPWRGPGRGPVEVQIYLRINTSTRPSPGSGAFHGNGHLRHKHGGRST
ncbi:hypothetical protein CRG98_050148, partial [Punica granatum]